MRYGDRVKRFATFNEPSVFTIFGYGFGWNAPGIADEAALHKAIHHVNLSHGRGSKCCDSRSATPLSARFTIGSHAIRPAAAMKIGMLHCVLRNIGTMPFLIHSTLPVIRRPSPNRSSLSRSGRYGVNRPALDWFGLNHYSPHYIKGDGNWLGATLGAPPAEVPRTPIGWPIVPDAFRDTLLDIHTRFRLPIYVLENGTADDDKLDSSGNIQDAGRIAYLQAYLAAMQEAISAGVDVRGYFVWSLLDNFEWTAGYSQRFGLVHVDFATQQRSPKASARWYSEFIKSSRHSSAIEEA